MPRTAENLVVLLLLACFFLGFVCITGGYALAISRVWSRPDRRLMIKRILLEYDSPIWAGATLDARIPKLIYGGAAIGGFGFMLALALVLMVGQR